MLKTCFTLQEPSGAMPKPCVSIFDFNIAPFNFSIASFGFSAAPFGFGSALLDSSKSTQA